MTVERRTRSRSPQEVSVLREYPKAPAGTNALLLPLAGSLLGEFGVPGKDSIFIVEEEGKACAGGTCVEITADLATADGNLVFQSHIAGNDEVRSWRAWDIKRNGTRAERVKLMKLDAALEILFERLAKQGITRSENPNTTP